MREKKERSSHTFVGEQFYMTYPSPVGEIAAVSDGEAITGLWFTHQQKVHVPMAQTRKIGTDLAVFRDLEGWLTDYFAGKEPGAMPPVSTAGTPFQEEIWALLKTIPYGQTTTYGALAAALGRPMSAQAVGGAVGHNPVAILIPCHRVVGSGGRLTGYAGGLECKEGLLKLEGILA